MSEQPAAMSERAERAILSHAEAYRLVEEARQMCEERDRLRAALAASEARADGLAVELEEMRAALNDPRMLLHGHDLRCGRNSGFGCHPRCLAATDPEPRGRAILEAGQRMAAAADRVVRGKATTQRYEYLADVLAAWRTLVGQQEGGA